MRPVAEIFSQGEELVTGHIVDSNAAWLSRRLVDMGFRVARHTAVGDDLADLQTLFLEIAERCDCCICTGGLGPTVDDLTAEAVALACGVALLEDTEAMRQIEAWFARSQRPMPAANRKQALLPAGALRIDNPLGTAPGFALRHRRCWFVFLPGVPTEMRAMFLDRVQAGLRERFRLSSDTLVTLRSIGLGESAIQQALADWPLPEAVQLGFRATPEDIQTKLRFPAGFPAAEREQCVAAVAERLGRHLFAIDRPERRSGDLMAVIAAAMRAQGRQLAVLETASQGLIAAKCLEQPWLASVEVRMRRDWHAAEPETAARTLAAELAAAQAALALVQLYTPQPAGDDGHGMDGQATIVVYNALHTPGGSFASRHTIAGTAGRRQQQAALLALDLLRRYLQHQCP